jgi:hypothetical protein
MGRKVTRSMKVRRALLAGGGALLLIPSAMLATGTALPGLLSHSTGIQVAQTTDTVQTAAGPKSIVNYTLQTDSHAVARPAAPAALPQGVAAVAQPAAAAPQAATGAQAAAPAANSKCPAPGAGHEYLVVWAGKMNAGDLTGKDAVLFVQGGAINIEGYKEVLPQMLQPGQDGMFTIDAEAGCDTYGKVVNIALIPGADGIENEPHHMQYIWFPGQSIWAGGLFTSRLFTFDASSLPQMKLVSIQEPYATPGGSIWDAFAGLPDGTAYGTLMGGPLYAYGMTPGEVVHVGAKGEILGQFPAGSNGEDLSMGANGLPSCPDLGSCANPHGIQARTDLHTLVTSDYAEPARIVEDPTKPENYDIFRRTVRVWDISNENAPKLVKVDTMPVGPTVPANPAHAANLGMMEVGKTEDYPMANGAIPKGMFSESMCGGAIFYTSDMTNTTAHPWHEVFDSTAAVFSPKAVSSFGGNTPNGGPNSQITEAGGCDGAAWVQVTPDNRFVLHAVNGRYMNQTTDFSDSGTPKMVYSIDVQKLLIAGSNYQCNLDNIRAVMDPTKGGADCPTVAGVVPVFDTSSGGPHWGAFDNFTLGTSGTVKLPNGRQVPNTHALTRLAFANYFVARTGVDGNHKVCMVNMDPQTGDMSLDNTFIDEDIGTPCVDFNRRDWLGGVTTGFYKPHSMLFVENGAPLTGRTFDAHNNTTGWWGHEVDNGVDTGGFPYSS